MTLEIPFDPRSKRPETYTDSTAIPIVIKPPSRISLHFTGSTPEVILDKSSGTIFMLGRLLCSNPHDFFLPFNEWAADYAENPQEVTIVTINTDYINTGSAMALCKFLSVLAKVQYTGRKIIVKWYCDKDDEDTRELITMMEEIIKVKIELEVG
jgi:hypothetical protein